MSHRRPSALILCLHRPTDIGPVEAPRPCHVEVPQDVRSVSTIQQRASSIPHPAPRRGLTLIEMLVALAVTLVMMAAVVNLFANISGSIRNRRAMIEASAQLRQARQRLQLDLAGATCQGRTWIQPAENQGYIEYIEGRWNDAEPSHLIDGDPNNGEINYATSLVPSGGDPTMNFSQVTAPRTAPLTTRPPQTGDVTNGRALGDWDDVLALTIRSESEPFTAQVGGNIVESHLAEVVWYAHQNDPGDPGEMGMRRIYRRLYLIAPWLGPFNNPPGNPPDNVSAHFDPMTNRWIANSLADLTKREYRATRRANSPFPHDFNKPGSDVAHLVLSDALAFDVRAFDPGAPLYTVTGGTVVQPGDIAWLTAAQVGGVPSSFGAYCDLGWNWNTAEDPQVPFLTGSWIPAGSPTRLFEFPRRPGAHPRSAITTPPLPLMGFPATYDTWSYHYENDGLNQEAILVQNLSGETPPPQFAPWQANVIDQGANGLDDDGVNGVDDVGERETAPPYDVPLRGLQVRLRIYERDARQVRESSVTHSFVP